VDVRRGGRPERDGEVEQHRSGRQRASPVRPQYGHTVSDATKADLDRAQFVSLTTYRRSGVAVPTTVWMARDGDALVVTTPATSGKVQRLRHDPRVQMRPSTRRGVVADDAVVVTGTAAIHADEPAVGRANAALRAKYGLQFRMITAVERLLSRDRGRVILRITLD
jgi:uncharacterized protein